MRAACASSMVGGFVGDSAGRLRVEVPSPASWAGSVRSTMVPAGQPFRLVLAVPPSRRALVVPWPLAESEPWRRAARADRPRLDVRRRRAGSQGHGRRWWCADRHRPVHPEPPRPEGRRLQAPRALHRGLHLARGRQDQLLRLDRGRGDQRDAVRPGQLYHCEITIDTAAGRVTWQLDGKTVHEQLVAELPASLKIGMGVFTVHRVTDGAGTSLRGQGLTACWRDLRLHG